MSQKWNADQYIHHASFVADHGLPVLDLLDPKPLERILDLGCGDGALTEKIQKMGAHVHGVDSSTSMIEAARGRGLSAEVLSGDRLTFKHKFDAVFSNAALHWMLNADAVIEGVSTALKDGGRFIGECGGFGNVDAIVRAMQDVFDEHPEFGEFNNPWYFPRVEEYQEKLENHNFNVTFIALIPRPTPLTSGIHEWLRTFSNGITRDLSEMQKTQFLNEVEQKLKAKLLVDSVWIADYVRLRFSAEKK